MDKSVLNSFSPSEKEILFLLLTDKSPKEIANSLNIKERTVWFHTTNIFKKVNVKNRYQLIYTFLDLAVEQKNGLGTSDRILFNKTNINAKSIAHNDAAPKKDSQSFINDLMNKMLVGGK